MIARQAKSCSVKYGWMQLLHNLMSLKHVCSDTSGF